MALRCHWPFNGCLCVIGLQGLGAAVRPASVFCKAFKAGKGMRFCGSSEKPSVCKLRKTTVITFTFPSYLDVTTSTRAYSCLNKSLNFSEWSVYVLQEDRVRIPVRAHAHALFPLLPSASW